MAFFKLLFPMIDEKEWREVNLNEQFIKDKDNKLNMSDPKDQIKLLDDISDKNTFYTFGGFGEDRTEIWKNVELNGQQLIHLGVDFNNLIVGEPVASISDGIVIYTQYDKTPINGWGGRIIIQNDNLYYMYGHLQHDLPKVGTEIKRGSIIGKIGNEEVNGGWFPHLHLQIMKSEYIKLFNSIEVVDGYAPSLYKELIIDPVIYIKELYKTQNTE